MLSVLFQSLLLASSGLLSIGSITIVILLLISDQGWRNGLGYALGYTSAYSLIGVSAVLLGYRAMQTGNSEPGIFVPILLFVLGALLVWLALRNWRNPPVENPEPPRFFAIVDSITPLKAFGFGALVSVINFKNLALFLTALSVVLLSSLALPQKIVTALLAALVFCLSVIIPVAIYLFFPKRARDVLDAIKQAIQRHSRLIGIWAPLFFGLIFILKGLSELL